MTFKAGVPPVEPCRMHLLCGACTMPVMPRTFVSANASRPNEAVFGGAMTSANSPWGTQHRAR